MTAHTNESSDRIQRFLNFLQHNPVGVLSTVTPDGDPHGVVIYYVIDKNLVVSFITRSGTRKHDNLKRNDHVMLTVFEPTTQATVQITGQAQQIEDSYDVNKVAGDVLQASMKTNEGALLPITKIDDLGPYVGYRIVPKQMRMAVFSRPDAGEYTDIFESIESFELKD